MKIEKSTGVKCPSCKEDNIVETFFIKYGKGNGIIGPGYHRPFWVTSEFGCPLCGGVYKPTPKNKLKEQPLSSFEESILYYGEKYTTKSLIPKNMICSLDSKTRIKELPEGTEVIVIHDKGSKQYVTSYEKQIGSGKYFLVPGKKDSLAKIVSEFNVVEVKVKPWKMKKHKYLRDPIMEMQLEAAKKGELHTFKQVKNRLPKVKFEFLEVFLLEKGKVKGEYAIPSFMLMETKEKEQVLRCA